MTAMRARGVARALAGALAVVVLAACLPSGFSKIDPSYTGVLITADATAPNDQYSLTAQNGSPLTQVDLSASATNTAGNLRSMFYPSGQAPTESGEVCATWVGAGAPSDRPQQGLAARVETNGSGPRRAITVTKNIWAGVAWILNVNLWMLFPDASLDTVSSIGIDYSSVVLAGGVLQPFPWRVCAEVAGNTVTTDVATGSDPPEPFADAADVRTVTLPEGWDYPGQFGWYIGHMDGGTTFEYTNLEAITPLPTTTTTSSTDPSSTTTTSSTDTSSTTAPSDTTTTTGT